MNWTVTVTGSSSGEIRSLQVNGRASTSGIETAVFDPPLLLDSAESYTVMAPDKSPLQNTTIASAPASGTTQGEPPAYYAWSDGMPFEVDSNAHGLRPIYDNSAPDYFIFTYRRSDAAISAGAVALVQYSSDLSAEWTTAEAGTDVIITPTEDGAATGVDTVEVKLRRSLITEEQTFVRLLVTVP